MKKLLLALLLIATPAFADYDLPPARYDIGGATIGEALANFHAIFGDSIPIQAVELGKAQETCNVISQRLWHINWQSDATAANGLILYGCGVVGSNPMLVYSYSPAHPGLEVTIFRHEAAHQMGWPAHHPR